MNGVADTTRLLWGRLARCHCEGMAATQALRTVEREAESGELRLLARGLADDIELGTSLSEAMERRPDAFGQGEVCLVRGGELSGVFGQALMLVVEASWHRPAVPTAGEAKPCHGEEEQSVVGRAPSGWHPLRCVDLLLYEMVKSGKGTRTLTAETQFPSEAPPNVPGQACDHAPPIDFPHVVNRLKVLANLWPVRYPQPVEGMIEIRISGEGYEVGARFVDMGECPSCTTDYTVEGRNRAEIGGAEHGGHQDFAKTVVRKICQIVLE